MPRLSLVLTGLHLLIIISAGAQPDFHTDTTLSVDGDTLRKTFDVVTVQSESHRRPLTISSINRKELDDLQNPTIEPLLNTIPGVWMQTGALNTNRISIRGVGYCEPFATSGIRVYWDEIPLTQGAGESSIEDIHPFMYSGIDVWRGPVSALWGAGLGGMIQLKSRVPQQNQSNTTIQYGSFNRFQFNQGISLVCQNRNTNGINAHYQFIQDDGFRENNEYRKHSVSLTPRWTFNNGMTIQGLVHVIDLKAYIPSSLTLEDFRNHPERAASNWASVNGHEDYMKWISGVHVLYPLSPNWVYRGAVFGTFFDSDEVRPFNVLQESSRLYGMRHRVSASLANQLTITTGMEWIGEQYRNRTYETLEGGARGDELNRLSERRSYFNVFAQGEKQLGDRWTILGGVHLPISQLTLEDDKVNPVVSVFPMLAINYSTLSALSLSASVSQGYSALSFDDLLNSSGQLNPDILPETGWNAEASIGLISDDNADYIKITAFHMDVKNTVLTRRLQYDEFEKLNGGSTRHRGLEIAFRSSTAISWIDFHLSLAFNDFTFIEFLDDDQDFSGNELPGFPRRKLYSRIDFQYAKKGVAFFEIHSVGDIWLNDQNSVGWLPGAVVNAGIRYSMDLGLRSKLDLAAQVDNLGDHHYASMFQLNAPGSEPRYYYPGKPRSLYLSMSFRHDLDRAK